MAFLEEKRSVFPRFYFIGDEDLLEILGQAKKPAVIQVRHPMLFVALPLPFHTQINNRIMLITASTSPPPCSPPFPSLSTA